METLSEQKLNQLYDEFSKEQQSLMSEMKNRSQFADDSHDKDVTKQLTLLNTITMGILRYRNLEKTIASKKNL